MSDTAAMSRIQSLIDRVLEAVNSEENRVRGALRPSICFATEDPIIWSHVFDIDIRQYFSEPLFYIEHYLMGKLWRWENFPEDDAPITPDLPAWLSWYCEYTFFDIDINFTYRGVPQMTTDHPLTCNPDMALLPREVDFYTSGWSPWMLKWYEDLRELVSDRLSVGYAVAWSRGCLDLAIQLRGYENFVMDCTERPEFIHDLLKYLVEKRCQWYDGYYEYFNAQPAPVGIADDWINIPFITPYMFEEFLLPRYLEIEAYHHGLANIHSCGDQAPIQKYLLQVKSLPSFEVSPWTSLEKSLENLPADRHLQIALHPNDVIYATPEQMKAQLQNILILCAGRPFAIGTGGLSPGTLNNNEFINKIQTWTHIARELRE